MKQEKILEILRRLDGDENEIRITNQTPLHDGATFTDFEVDIAGCGPDEAAEVFCITYDGDEEHLFHPADWLGGALDDLDEIEEFDWLDQDNHPAVFLNGLPRTMR